MTIADTRDPSTQDLAARLRHLLTELEDAPTAHRSDPRSQHQLDLCTEVEAILRVRSEKRPVARSA